MDKSKAISFVHELYLNFSVRVYVRVSCEKSRRCLLEIKILHHVHQGSNFIAAIAAIAVEGEQNAVDHCGNDGNLLPYSAIFILFTVHYYFDT
jgi:hypothetical protein